MSELFHLNFRDIGRGLLVAVFSAVVTFLYTAVTAPDFAFSNLNLAQMGTVAMIAALSYLMKNFLSDSEGKLGGVI